VIYYFSRVDVCITYTFMHMLYTYIHKHISYIHTYILYMHSCICYIHIYIHILYKCIYTLYTYICYMLINYTVHTYINLHVELLCMRLGQPSSLLLPYTPRRLQETLQQWSAYAYHHLSSC